MDIVNKKVNKPSKKYFELFLNKYWYIPSDVLQRSLEASIWDICKFNHPILDIGIGNGYVDIFLFKNIKKIDVGIDIEKEGLKKAVETKKFKKVLYEDASKMNFKNSSFNSVIANSTFEHIENDIKAIAEVSRVLKKGGHLYITVPNKNLSKWIYEIENKSKSKLEKFNARANHLHYRSEVEWGSIFKKNGMQIAFSRSYFKKDVAMFWYRLFKIFTYEIGGKEIWSYFHLNKLLNLIPKNLYIFLVRLLLVRKFNNGFFTSSDGGMSFFVVQKI